MILTKKADLEAKTKGFPSPVSSEEEEQDELDDIDVLEGEVFNDEILSNTSYQKIFKRMIKEMAIRSELEGDIDEPLIGYLETETRKKLGILFKKNFEKYKEAVIWIMRKREKTPAFTFCLRKQPSLIEEAEPAEEVKAAQRVARRRRKVVLDTEWIRREAKVHRGDGKLILYPNECVFQVLFPDGTGQIHYPSGNLAMLIFETNINSFTYIILEDSKQKELRALITNSGHATFYDENRDIWLSLSRNLGYYFAHGRSQKAWNWWDLDLHVHAPPFQPITLEINQYIKVFIESQDKIFLRFTAHRQKQICLNLGTKFKFIPPETLKEMKKREVLAADFRPAARRIHILLGRMRRLLRGLSAADLEDFVESAQAWPHARRESPRVGARSPCDP
ncbi:glutamate-rich protein 6B [Dasypus novemcinctus]|uniref:glutamate-rich protein 6B n=1 Tax=Dasypus novemcinctus TaxID=9361 RepID=UPI0039C99FB4